MKNKIRIKDKYVGRELSFVAQLFEYNIEDTVLLADALLDRDGEFSLTYSPKGSGILGLSITSRFGPPINAGSVTVGGFVTVITGYEAQQVTMTICNEGDDKYRFGFNGKEKDNEVKGVGNSLDFGARIYDSRLGRWLSLDPLAKKYPSMSPYCFVGNTPTVFKDYDGRDYDIQICHEAKQIIVTANYWSVNNTRAENQAIDEIISFWNGQNGKFQYAVGEGNNKIYYDIFFDLRKTTGSEVFSSDATHNNVNIIGNKRFDDLMKKLEFSDAEGVNLRDNLIIPQRNKYNGGIQSHEAGHGLGSYHYEESIMAVNAEDITPDVIGKIIEDILGGGGIGVKKNLKNSPADDLHGKAMKVGGLQGGPNGFIDGTVQRNNKAVRKNEREDRKADRKAKPSKDSKQPGGNIDKFPCTRF